jgi:hypothetical protein
MKCDFDQYRAVILEGKSSVDFSISLQEKFESEDIELTGLSRVLPTKVLPIF